MRPSDVLQYPVDQSAAVLTKLYPAAAKGSRSYNAPGAAHALNFHYEAPAAFAQIQAFVKANGL